MMAAQLDEPKKFRIGPASGLALLLPLLFLLSGCGTTKTYTPVMAAGPAKPAGYPIPVYPVAMPLPRPCEVIGRVEIGDTELTMHGGSLTGVTKTLLDLAREKGADAVQLLVVEKPDFNSSHYRLSANLLRYAAPWETETLSFNEFLAYLQRHRSTMDPIEGIWDDGSPERLGIIKDTARPGRDFIAFTLDPLMASWHYGYKKMDIAHLSRPGAYRLRYYRDDFVGVNTGLLLEDHGHILTFNLPAGDGENKVSFGKIPVPVPAH
ncbi:MAG TPA: hypothetical protein VNN22_00190 [Verrucomicrobiae bacterium]|nr:hypothetical protein [Verrucomicrobiae bacterium]